MADLVTGLDWDAAVEAGLTTDLGIADDVVTQLSDDERRELQQLLRMELGEGKYKVQSTKDKVKLQSGKCGQVKVQVESATVADEKA